MPDQDQMSMADFAKVIKTKYPDYANVPDDELARRMIAKYPVYKSRIKEAQAPPQKPPPTYAEAKTPAERKAALAGTPAVEDMTNLAKGAARGAVSTVQTLASPIRKAFGMQPATKPAEETTTAGKIGRIGEQAAEFAITGNLAKDAAALVNIPKAAAKASAMVKLVSRYGRSAVESALQAAGAFGTAKLQGDAHPGRAAAVGAAGPVVGEVAEATAPALKTGATRGLEKLFGGHTAATTPALEKDLSKAVPLALEKGLPTSWRAWSRAATAGRRGAGEQLEKALAGSAGDELLPKKPVLDAVDDLLLRKGTHFVPPAGFKPGPGAITALRGAKAIVYNKAMRNVVKEIHKTLDEYPGDYLQARQMVNLKQMWDEVVFPVGESKQLAVPLADRLRKADRLTKMTASNAVRTLLDGTPTLGEIDATVSRHIKLDQVIKKAARVANTSVLTKSAQAVGTAVGTAVGGWVDGWVGAFAGGVTGSATGLILKRAIASPLWRTLPAFTKNSLAEALVSGKADQVRQIVMPLLTRTAAGHQTSSSSISASKTTSASP
jgi:hypothetical protein